MRHAIINLTKMHRRLRALPENDPAASALDGFHVLIQYKSDLTLSDTV